MEKRSVLIFIRCAALASLWMLISVLQVSAQLDSASKPTADYSSAVASAWFNLQLQLVQQTPGFTPPVAARAFGYSGVALYEAVVPGMPGYETLAGQLNALSAVPQPV